MFIALPSKDPLACDEIGEDLEAVEERDWMDTEVPMPHIYPSVAATQIRPFNDVDTIVCKPCGQSLPSSKVSAGCTPLQGPPRAKQTSPQSL